MTALETFRERLPKRPLCTDDFQRGMYRCPKEEALGMRYIEHYTPKLCHSILLDVDNPEGGATWIDEGAPPPNLVVQNPENGHAKLIYQLSHPVPLSEKARIAPIEMLRRANLGLTYMVGGDLAFYGRTTNNPLHPEWNVKSPRESLYELRELLEAVETAPKTLKVKEYREDEAYCLGRNDALWRSVYKYGALQVKEVKKTGTLGTWIQQMEALACLLNDFDTPLQIHEARSVGRSIARSLWRNAERLKTGRKHIRSNEREPITPEEAQRRMDVARRAKGKKTEEKIKKALKRLEENGKEASIRAVAKEAGISTTTVKNHRKKEKEGKKEREDGKQ